MPNQLEWEIWPITAVVHQIGEDCSDYAIYYKGRKVQRIVQAGRFDNMYRLIFGGRDTATVDKHCKLTVGV